MEITRRQSLILGAGAAVIAGLPLSVWAEENGMTEAIQAFTKGADVPDGDVEIDAPDIAENGYTVPISVSANQAEAILLLAPGNPTARVAEFRFGALSAVSSAKTRIRLARNQHLLAIARFQDGSFARTIRPIQVTVGGCSA